MRPRARALLVGLLAAALALQGPGCGLVFHRTQAVDVRCDVPGAQLTIDGAPVAPGSHDLRTGTDHVVTASAPGYVPRTVVIKGKEALAARFLVLDLLWVLAYGAGIVFLIVDLASDSLWDLAPRQVLLRLEPAPPPVDVARAPAAPTPAAPEPALVPVAPAAPAPKRAPPRLPAPLTGQTRVLAVAPAPEAAAWAAGVCALTDAAGARALTGGAAGRAAVLRAVREHLERAVERDDRAVLYFGGGLREADDGEVYLLAADTDPGRLEETAIAAATLADYLERVEGAALLLLVDDAAGDVDPARAAAALAVPGAVTAVGRGEAAGALARGLRRGRADADADARVSAAELAAWLERSLGDRGAVRAAAPGAGAFPVLE
ncbi:MAG: hypothetical protein M9894_13200 [Planctomycetes bacterium]|nr:hypothetical protein [Planctomycetota bacterium]